MDEQCKVCLSELDDNGNCPVCGNDQGAEPKDGAPSGIKHIDGKKANDGSGDIDYKSMQRTRPVKVDMEKIKSTLASADPEDEEEIDLSPEDIEIDFNKLDASTLFDDEFEEEKISSKMLPQIMRPKDKKKTEREISNQPSETALRKRKVYAVPDLADGEVESSKGVAIRTKKSMVKKGGSSLVLLIAMAIIFIIILALYITGFLDFAT